MASTSDVKAGSAYVQLGLRDNAFLTGLSKAMARLHAFAESAMAFGKRIALFGFGIAGGLVAIAASSVKMDALVTSLQNLRAAAGGALASAVQPLVDGLARVVVRLTDWLEKNPGQVRAVFNMALAVGVLGTAVALLAGAVWALTSPLVLATALFVGLGGAALAVTDILGVTNTGFAALFDSIRIKGQGLGTWSAKLWTFLVRGWHTNIFAIGSMWDWLSVAAGNSGDRIYSALIWVPRALLVAFRGLVDGINTILSGLATAWNKTVGLVAGEMSAIGPIGTETVNRWIAELEQKQGGLAQAIADRERGFRARQSGRERGEFESLVNAESRFRELDARDPSTGDSLLRIDTDRFKEALAGIGENIGGALNGALNRLAGGAQLPNGAVAQAAVTRAQRVDVLGTFNASAAGRLGVGSSLQERQAKAGEDTARNTRQILEELRNGGGLAFR